MVKNIVPKKRIYAVQYYILSNEENIKDSTVTINNKELFKQNKPVQEGIYDPHMGTTDFSWTCATCSNYKGVCPGHPGILPLRYPVKNPNFREYVAKWLKVICFRCGNLLIENIPKTSSKKILPEINKLIKADTKCFKCNFPAKKIEVDKNQPQFLQTVIDEEKREIYNHEIAEIFEKIPNKLVQKLGFELTSHPRNLIVTHLRIPPNTIRPEIKMTSGGKSSNNDITTMLKKIVELNASIGVINLFGKLDARDVEKCHNLELFIHEMIRGSSQGGDKLRVGISNGKSLTSLDQRFSGKHGHIRRLLMGKRVFVICRAVIITDPTVEIGEVGLSKAIVSKLQIIEVATPYNIHQLQIYVNNRRDRYPGVKELIINGQRKSIEKVPENYTLRVGDTVYRDLIDGDYVCLNRQPSLTYASLGAHRVKVMEEGVCIRLNVSACGPYNADFDGDQMHVIVVQKPQARVEIEQLSSVKRWMISYQTSAPSYGNYYDSLIGSALLSRQGVEINKEEAMRILSNVWMKDKHNSFDKDIYAGRDIISMILPNINYPAKSPSFYMKQYVQYIKYNPEDIQVRINRGKLISGVLDKETSGPGEKGSIFHIINNEFGAEVALKTIFYFHQICNRFLLYRGFTSGYKDMLLPEKTENKIRDKISKILADSEAITNKLNNRTLIPPKGVTLESFYESEQLAVLDPGEDFIEPVLENTNIYDNGIAELIFHKSKGKASNFLAINAAIGSQTVNDKRPARSMGGRTAIYYQRYEDSPISLGYVTDSWRTGIRPESYIFSCAESKHGLINNALVTCVSGAQMRISMKNVDSSVIDNSQHLMKNMNVVQFLYGDNGIDTQKTEKVKINTIKISDKEMEEYHMYVKSFDKKFQNPEVQKYLDKEFEQLLKDRKEYRELHMRLEDYNQGRYIFDNQLQLPINPYRIIDDTYYRHESLASGILDPVKAIEKVEKLCKRLGYVFRNAQCEKSGVEIPEVHEVSLLTAKILIRSYLCTFSLIKAKINDELLDIIIDKTFYNYKNCIIAGGFAAGVLAAHCLCEPLTQFILNSKHRSGGSSRVSVSVMDRIREVFSAKPTDKMKMPTMLIMVKEEYEKDKAKVQEIASYIKVLELDQFVLSVQIFEEQFMNPVHPEYKKEKKWMEAGLKYSAKPPGNLLDWCIRYELSREEMYINSLKLDKLIYNLQVKNPEVYILHTSEFSEDLVIRIYFKPSMFKTTSPSRKTLKEKSEKLRKTIIRGIEGIKNTEVVDIPKTYIAADGSVQNDKVYAIVTIGTNLREVLENPYIDPYKTQTDSILEFEEMYGIEAARNKITSELLKVIDKAQYTHCSVFSDEMCSSGYVTAIQKGGLSVREKDNVALRLSFQAPLEILRNACMSSAKHELTGISGQFIFGQLPRIGTTYNDVLLDTDFVEEFVKNKDKQLMDAI